MFPPFENFLYCNKFMGNSRRIVSLSSSQHQFVSFSEREIAAFFLEAYILKERLVRLGELDNSNITLVRNLDTWIAGKEPGFITENFVAHIPPPSRSHKSTAEASWSSNCGQAVVLGSDPESPGGCLG